MVSFAICPAAIVRVKSGRMARFRHAVLICLNSYMERASDVRAERYAWAHSG